MKTNNSRGKLRILFITSATHSVNDRNFNHFQRVFFLSRDAELTILARKGSAFSASAAPGTRIVHSPWPGKAGHILFSLAFFVTGAARKFDVVLTEPSLLGVCGFLAKLFGTSKWAVDVWDIPIRSRRGGSILNTLRFHGIRQLMKLLYRYADLFIVSILPDYELSYFSIPAEKMLLLQNAIWLEDPPEGGGFADTGGPFSILCMRSVYTDTMGLDTLADAYFSLYGKIPALKLIVVGRIPVDIERQIAPLRNRESVSFFDFVEHEALEEMIRSVSVCVIPFKDVPDLAQTYPIKVIEYLSLGKPVIASGIEGMKRMIRDGENGLLFHAGDAEDLAEKILLLHRNERLRRDVAYNAAHSCKQFDCREKNRVIINKLERIANVPAARRTLPQGAAL